MPDLCAVLVADLFWLGTGPISAASLYEQRRRGPEGGDGRKAARLATHSWEYGWQWRAACRGEEASVFFAPNHSETKEEKHVREHRAKAICAICPVRIECLEYAVRTHESHGIWGGLNELERRLLIRERERRAAGDRLWGVR